MADAAPHELLVVLATGAGADAAAAVGRVAPVLQTAGTRVLIVDAAPAAAARLRAVAGVARVVTDPRMLGAVDDLDAGEQLFAQAWAARQTDPKSGPRRGDGMAWDAPGFDPP